MKLQIEQKTIVAANKPELCKNSSWKYAQLYFIKNFATENDCIIINGENKFNCKLRMK